MLEKSRLEELSLELPEKERKTLLERIGRRMEKEEGEEAVAVELQPDEREKIIAFELKKASPWVRFLLWVRTFMTGKDRKDIFLEIRLAAIKAHLRTASPGLTGFESRDLTPKFARKLYDVYLKTLSIGGVYHAFAADKAVRGAAYTWYLEERLEAPKRGIDDFVTTEEMEEIFAQSGQAEEITKKLSLRLNEYVRAIPETFILKREEEAKLHLALGKLAAFPFAAFFRYFNCVLPDTPDPRSPTFESAPIMLTLDLMEKLHVALSLVKRCAPEYLYPEEPVAFYLAVRGGVTPGDTREAEKRATELARLRSDIMELGREIDAFEAAVPLLDLLRWFRRDPWYQLVFNAPKLYLRTLAFSTLKARLSVQLEEKVGAIKERVINRKVDELLKGQKPVEFVYYKTTPDFDFRKLSLPYFSCIRSLALVYNFLLQQFKGATQEAAQLAAGTVLANNRITQTRLGQNISGLEDLEARIVLFDRSLSPDEEDGKQMARFRIAVATDLLLQKTYRAFVQQKDREARDLIDKAREYLAGVRKVFDEIRTSTFESTRSLLKTIHLYRGRNQTLGQVLNARSEVIGSFVKLLDQLLELEKGT
jgi:hypothetical protein